MAFEYSPLSDAEYQDLRFRLIGAAEDLTLFGGNETATSRLRGDNGKFAGRAMIGYGYDLKAQCGTDINVFRDHLRQIGAGSAVTPEISEVLSGYLNNAVVIFPQRATDSGAIVTWPSVPMRDIDGAVMVDADGQVLTAEPGSAFRDANGELVTNYDGSLAIIGEPKMLMRGS